jgi:hypothetical protein
MVRSLVISTPYRGRATLVRVSDGIRPPAVVWDDMPQGGETAGHAVVDNGSADGVIY